MTLSKRRSLLSQDNFLLSKESLPEREAMAAVNPAKVKEGDKLVAEAEKRYDLAKSRTFSMNVFIYFCIILLKTYSLKTSWLKWNPDYDSAAHSFDKAGKWSLLCTFIIHLQICLLTSSFIHL